MEPLHVTAYLLESLSLRSPLHLDALLMWSVSIEEQRPSPIAGESLETLDIPIQRDPSNRFWLTSQSFFSVERSRSRYKNLRAPWHEQVRLGDGKVKRIDITSGIDRGMHFPYEVQYLVENRIDWWCIGDREEILRLLSRIRYLGRFRGSGKGKLDFYHRAPWTVEPCDPWDGFPVVRNGKPLRPLPPNYPGIVEPRVSYTNLEPPYWDRSKVMLCAVPDEVV